MTEKSDFVLTIGRAQDLCCAALTHNLYMAISDNDTHSQLMSCLLQGWAVPGWREWRRRREL
jgi:hypothetical protein